MITLAREFISPDESFACGDDVLAQAADHSTEVDVAHYAVVHGALPRITNNDMNRHRWLAKEWGSLLGMGPLPPPEAVQVVRMKARSEKLPDASELAAKVSTLVSEAVMSNLAAIGLTRETIQKLSLAAEGQSVLALGPSAPPKRPTSPHPSTPSPWPMDAREPSMSVLEEEARNSSSLEGPFDPTSDGTNSPCSSTLDDPWHSSAWDIPSTAGGVDSRWSRRLFEALPGKARSPHASTPRVPPSEAASTVRSSMFTPGELDPHGANSPCSSTLDDPWHSSAWDIPSASPEHCSKPTILVHNSISKSASEELDSCSSRSKHPFETPPGTQEGSPYASALRFRPSEVASTVQSSSRSSRSKHTFDTPANTPWIRSSECLKRAAAASGQGNESPSPSKRRRLPPRNRHTSGVDEDEAVEEHGIRGDGRKYNSLDDFVQHDAPVPADASTQPSSSSSGKSEALSAENIVSHGMSDESPLWDNIRHAMQVLLKNPDVREKSLAQLLGIELVMQGQQDAMITMRTGGGKSMLWLVPPMLDKRIKLLVVCPYKVLLDEQCMRAQKAGLAASSFARKPINPEIQILFLQVEQVKDNSGFAE